MNSLYFVYYYLVFIINFVNGTEEESLVARDVLKTIAPVNSHIELPPGFPTINTISTEKFHYKTSGNTIEVQANLDDSITMFPDYLTISNIKMHFFYDKTKKGNWTAEARGTWEFGASTLNLKVFANGSFTSYEKSFSLLQIKKKFMKNNNNKSIGIAESTFAMKNVYIVGEISKGMENLRISFEGKLSHRTLDSIPIKITVSKQHDKESETQLYSVIEFHHVSPRKVLSKMLDQKMLSTSFFDHLLQSSDLFGSRKKVFGVAFSYSDVYYYKDLCVSCKILSEVMQSHIPTGITLLLPIETKQQSFSTKNNRQSGGVNLAFVINNPLFDLLISQHNKMSVTDILPILSRELSIHSNKDILPGFVKDLESAYTTHISFDSSTREISMFIRLQENVELIPDLMRIQVTNLVLQKKLLTSKNKNNNWKISAKGNYTIGKATFKVQYSQLQDESNDNEEVFGLTGVSDGVTLDDIIEQFDPEFYPDDEVREMIQNTEISTLILRDVKLYSRVQKNAQATPHVLFIGHTDLPQWEKNIQVAVLLFFRQGAWECKWAISMKHSPLTSIVEALTGYDGGDLDLLHNSHIMTTLISSPDSSYERLPPHVITTPLLRLPIEKGLNIIALLRFPDTCGDDKMCTAASELLDTRKLYTAKGKLSTNEFKLYSTLVDDIQFSDSLNGENNTLEFTIGNISRFDILTSIRMPHTRLIFDGHVHIYSSGGIQLQMFSRQKRWISPFSLRTISFKDVSFVADYENGHSIQKIDLQGTVSLGLQGNGAEIDAPVRILYNPSNPTQSTFYSNFTNIRLTRLLEAFTLDVQLPSILEDSSFPNGLMLTYSGLGLVSNDYSLHGELNILGRLLYCYISLQRAGFMGIVTDNSPAPVIFAKGLIIVQEDQKSKLRGPKIMAQIGENSQDIIMKGYVKLLGMESDVEINLRDTGIEFTITGKLMDYKETHLTAYSIQSPDSFHVIGCLEEIALEMQFLLVEMITKSSNQSVENMRKAEENYFNAQRYFLAAVKDESDLQRERNEARRMFEDALIEYGKYLVKTKEVCPPMQCGYKCFGCPKLIRCCRLDIFGHCIACPSWKKCCWKNIDPLCIAKQDGCHVIKAQAEKELATKETKIVQQRIMLDHLEQLLTKAEIEKGKHRAVLEAAIDAKQIVEEDSTAGLNAHDVIVNYGPPHAWTKIHSVCYDTSVEQVATGCMQLIINVQLFRRGEQKLSIWSCLKEDLITELTEAIANYMFPNMVDASSDSVSEVASKLNGAKIQNQITDNHQTPVSITGKRPGVDTKVISLGNFTASGTNMKYNTSIMENLELEKITPPQVNDNVNWTLLSGNRPTASPSSQSDNGMHQPDNSTWQVINDNKMANNSEQATELKPPSLPMTTEASPLQNQNNGNYNNQLKPIKRPIQIKVPQQDEESIVTVSSGEEDQGSTSSGDYFSNSGDIDNTSSGSNQSETNSTSGEDSGSTDDAKTDKIDEDIVTKNDGNFVVDIESSGEDNENKDEGSIEDYNNVSSISNKTGNQQQIQKEYTQVGHVNNNNDNINQGQLNPINTTNIYPYIAPVLNYKQNSQQKFQQQQRRRQKQTSTSNLTNFFTTNRFQYSQPSYQRISQYNPIVQSPNPIMQRQYFYSNESMERFNKTKSTFVNRLERRKRSIDKVLQSDARLEENNGILYTNPFWNIPTEYSTLQTRSFLPRTTQQKKHHQMLSGMIQKRWSIPENPDGKCHIFHQLVAICKDMAETIITLDKSLKLAKADFEEEDKNVYLELFETEENLVAATKRVNISADIAVEAAKTLSVVREGVNIWSKRCTSEFDWQAQTGVYAWLQTMDLRIQELGGYGVFRFFDNLLNAFQALFDHGDVRSVSMVENYEIIGRTRRISEAFRQVFKNKLDVGKSSDMAIGVLTNIEHLKRYNIAFCH